MQYFQRRTFYLCNVIFLPCCCNLSGAVYKTQFYKRSVKFLCSGRFYHRIIRLSSPIEHFGSRIAHYSGSVSELRIVHAAKFRTSTRAVIDETHLEFYRLIGDSAMNRACQFPPLRHFDDDDDDDDIVP